MEEDIRPFKEIYEFIEWDKIKDSIPKSVIREKIEELEEAKESDCGSNKGVERLCNGMIAILKELLE